MATPANENVPVSPYRALISERTVARRRLTRSQSALAALQADRNNLLGDDAATEEVRALLDEREVDLLEELEGLMTEANAIQARIDRALSQRSAVSIPVFALDTFLDEPEDAYHSPESNADQVPHMAHTRGPRAVYREAPRLSRITLPVLKDTLELAAHLNDVERLLLEEGVGERDSTGNFVPPQNKQFSVAMKLAETLGTGNLRSVAEELARYDMDWGRLKRNLLDRYVSPLKQADEFQRRIANLKWSGCAECSVFIDNVRAIWRIGRAMDSYGVLKRDLVQAVCRTIPHEVLRRVLDAVQAAEIPNWEVHVNLDGDEATAFCNQVRLASRAVEILSRANGGGPPPPVTPAAGLKQIVPHIRSEDYHRLLVARFGKDTTQKTQDEAAAVLGTLPYKPYQNRKGQRGMMIGCPSDTVYEAAKLKLTSLGLTCHDFVPREAPPSQQDKISRVVGAQMEYFVRGHVEACGNTGPLMALEPMPLLEIDSGAGFNYLIPTQELKKKLAEHLVDIPDRFGVSMANGVQTVVSKKLRSAVTLYSASPDCLPVTRREVDIYVLDGHNCEHSQILLGRESINAFDLVVSKHGVSTEAGTKLMDVTPGVVVPLRDTCCFASAESVDSISTLLQSVVQREWVPLLRSDGYKIRLKSIEPNDAKDHPEQTHLFEVSVPRDSGPHDQSDETIKKIEADARGTFQRMDAVRRERQKSLVDGYLDSGWWKETSPAECKKRSRFSPVNVFMVGGGAESSRKARLVVNFKPVNKNLPTSSTPSTAPAHLLSAFRYQNPECVIVSDAASAFYKIRLEEDLLWLIVAVEEGGSTRLVHCLSDRVVFGIVFGPSSLITSMTELFQEKGRLTPALTAFSGWYMDDNILAGPVKEVCDSLAITVALLRRTGHDLQLTKCSAICATGVKDAFARRLSEIGEIVVAESAKVLGVEVDFNEDKCIRIRCSSDTRSIALRLLAVPPESAMDVRLTKAEHFSVAGALSYDIVKDHTEERYLADAIRSLIGREFSDIGWHKKLDLNLLSPKKQECWKIIAAWATELVGVPPCCHVAYDAGQTISMYADASTVGGGFCITAGGNRLWADSWRWCGAETRWHINFQELNAVYRALRALADIVECMIKCVPRDRSNPRICIYNDNKSAVKWSSIESTDILSKHQSRRSLTRLVDKINDEWKVLKDIGTVSVEHLPGLLNVRADALSRYGARRLTDTSVECLQDLLECERKQKLKVTFDCSVLEAVDKGALDGIEEPDAELIHIEDFGDEYFDSAAVDKPWLWPSSEWSLRPRDVDKTVERTPATAINYTGGPIIDFVDRVNILREPLTTASVGWAETVAADCYDVSNMEFYVKLMQKALRAWYSQRKGEGREEVMKAKAESFEVCVARSAQHGMNRDRLPKAMRGDVGPLFESNECWFYRAPTPTGEYIAWPFIPNSKERIQSLILRDAHRKCGHMGIDYTLSRVEGLVLHNARAYAKGILRACMFCQRKRAERSFKHAFESVHDRPGHGPYQSVAVDHLSIGENTEVLVVLCLATGHATVSACSDGTTEATAVALRRVFYRFGTRPSYVLADKAPNIAAAIQCLRGEFGNMELDQTTARSQFENGKIERLNGILLPIATAKFHFDKLKLGKMHPLELQDVCDYLSWQLNQRPLACYVSEVDSSDLPIVLTPQKLVFGSCTQILTRKHPWEPKLNEWRLAHDQIYWKELKKRSDLAVRGKSHTFQIAEPVLYFKPGTKLELSWRLAHVIDMPDPKRLKLRDVNGKELLMHEYNICPITAAPGDSTDYDVTRAGAPVSTTVDGVEYSGIVTLESAGRLLVSWDTREGKSWAPEWCPATSLKVG